MIGILFATEMEAKPFLERGEPENTVTVISGMGMEAARIATERLIREHGCTSIINAGVCGALNNRLERGAVYRVSMVSTEHLKAAVNVGVGIGLKRLVTALVCSARSSQECRSVCVESLPPELHFTFVVFGAVVFATTYDALAF